MLACSRRCFRWRWMLTIPDFKSHRVGVATREREGEKEREREGSSSKTRCRCADFAAVLKDINVVSIPTLLAVTSGTVLDVRDGAVPMPQLQAFVDGVAAATAPPANAAVAMAPASSSAAGGIAVAHARESDTFEGGCAVDTKAAKDKDSVGCSVDHNDAPGPKDTPDPGERGQDSAGCSVDRHAMSASCSAHTHASTDRGQDGQAVGARLPQHGLGASPFTTDKWPDLGVDAGVAPGRLRGVGAPPMAPGPELSACAVSSAASSRSLHPGCSWD